MNLAAVKCIVSGGAQGLGRHLALRLSQAGAQVAIGDVNAQGLADTLELARGSSGKIHARQLDVSQESEVRSLVDWAHGAMGGLNGLVNKQNGYLDKAISEFRSILEDRYPELDQRGFDFSKDYEVINEYAQTLFERSKLERAQRG